MKEVNFFGPWERSFIFMDAYSLVRFIINLVFIVVAIALFFRTFFKSKPMTAKFIARTAVFSAFSIILYTIPFFKFALPIFPAFLEIHLDEIPAFISKRLNIHFENNKPLTVFNYAIKTFQVSHWGNIAVTEEYQIENIGAKLIGEFGRIDYDNGMTGGKNALKSIRATLPLRAWGLWYRDEIGNVSTSNAKREMNDVDLLLTPRFPILGGWKSNYDIGYNLPTKFHVKTNNKGNYMVNLTFGMPYKNMLARNYTVKIILPESADNINVKLPIDTQYHISYDKEYGCLDLFGRKSIIINLNNMYDVYNTNIFITYDYQWTMLFVKPLILIVYFLILFTITIIYSRANVSLSRKEEIRLKDE